MGDERTWSREECASIAYAWARAVYHPPELQPDLVRLLAAWLSTVTEFGVLPADLSHVTVTRLAVGALRARDERRHQPDEDDLYY